jgi:CheY-like chemotaxis protein
VEDNPSDQELKLPKVNGLEVLREIKRDPVRMEESSCTKSKAVVLFTEIDSRPDISAKTGASSRALPHHGYAIMVVRLDSSNSL